MRLIHCADIHLDSAQETNLSVAKARQRNYELCVTFERMAVYAKNNRVSAVMICGDFFDSLRISPSTIHFVLDVIGNCKDVDFLFLQGNHDIGSWLVSYELPENLKLFGNTWKTYHYDMVTVSGVELTEDNYADIYGQLALKPNAINIVMMHGVISQNPAPESVSLRELSGKHIDYLALGHIHSYQTGKIDHRGTYCYSGCPEGRGYDECGDKGFVLLEYDGVRLQHEFIPFAQRTLHSFEVDISQCHSDAEVITCLREATAHIPDSDLVRFRLIGTAAEQYVKNIDFIANVLCGDFYHVKMIDDTKLEVVSHGAKAHSLKQAFVDSVLKDSSLSDQEKQTVIRYGCTALDGKERVLWCF